MQSDYSYPKAQTLAMLTAARGPRPVTYSIRSSRFLHTAQLLNIYAEQGLDEWDWNSQDGLGWTILHRAAAFGRSKDLKKLVNLGAEPTICTFMLKWLPISCAVKFGNEDTFDFLVDLFSFPQLALSTLVDSRGWNLLHLAAENGSEDIMTKLLRLDLDPLAKTDGSSIAVPERLALREVTAGDIAEFFGNEEAYVRVLKATGYADMGERLALNMPGTSGSSLSNGSEGAPESTFDDQEEASLVEDSTTLALSVE